MRTIQFLVAWSRNPPRMIPEASAFEHSSMGTKSLIQKNKKLLPGNIILWF